MQAESAMTQDRRAFLHALARYPIVGGLALLGTWLASRRATTSSVAVCLKERTCRQCALYAGCALPQAARARHGDS